MLRLRIITAVVLAGSILAAIAWLPMDALAVVFWGIAAAGCYEWAGLAGLSSRPQRLAYVGVFGVLAALLYGQVAAYQEVLILGCGVWVMAVIAVLLYPRGKTLFTRSWFTAVLGMLVLVPGWLALVVIREQPQGQLWLLWTFFIAWGADIGGYFAGRAFGRHKLAPAVSPGKTWEGAAGGFLFALVVCGIGVYWLTEAWQSWLPIIAGLIVVSVFGDLFESVLKRATGVKDSGSLLPGHGGVLDRIDSLLAILPIFAFILVSN